METVTLTQEEYEEAKAEFDKEIWFEEYLNDRMKVFKDVRNNNEKFYKIYHKAELMLRKLQFEKYDYKSLETVGRGEEEQISYLEYKDGTPLTEDELFNLWHDNSEIHDDLIISKRF